ncbi:MAG TPA: T9SS type A sorting domain-containing protein, partial [Candidatus Marinimicrobia bacterium]|nr:T9SS type A sorting domain-containing protein [Candidatus Neomarinimicrobiota bacterium]
EHTVNQNEGSGDWRYLGEYQLKEGDNFSLIINYSGPSQSGMVLRADAIRLTRLDDTSISEEKASQFILHPVYPNPFNATTTFHFSLPSSQDLTLSVYNLNGQLLHKQNGFFTGGTHSWQLDFSGKSSGVYFYMLASSQEVRTGKLMLVK